MKTIYNVSFQIQVGIIKKLLLIQTQKRGSIEVAFITRCEVNTELRHQTIRPVAETDIVKTDSIQSVLHVVHDCKRGFCKVIEGNCEERSEQQTTVLQNQTYLEHSSRDVFFYNKFRLSKLPDKL